MHVCMDGREGMTLSGSASYCYLHSGIGGGGATQPSFNHPTEFRNLTNPTIHQFELESNFRPTFSVGFSPLGFLSGSGSEPLSLSLLEEKKKKRGRPRKYSPDGSAAVSLSEKRKRGRPPGSGRKQRLASVGEWMSTSAGAAFTPHVIYVSPGEDIASKILSFSQRRQRALCIMSASGGASTVTLHQPASSVGNLTYEGQFEILCLSGSYVVAETGGARNRTGGINVSLASPDGQVIGGSVANRLIASRPTQVVAFSFVYGNQNQKPSSTRKTKSDSDSKDENNSCGQQSAENTTEAPVIALPVQQITPANVGWPNSECEAHNGRNHNTDIDLMRGG